MNQIENTEWKTYNPVFEHEKLHQDAFHAWSGHKNFAYDLVANFKPGLIVELGTLRGTSLFSMCQAVKDLSINTRLFAVDRWEGNRDNGYFGDEFYALVNNIKNKYFGQLSLELFREDFNTAVLKFENKTIDLLHIDGLHTYEDVKNDFETWLPKVSPDGIILFHDTTALNDDFGVYKLWDELRGTYNFHYSFVHSHGLGVLFLGKSSVYAELLKSFNLFAKEYYELRSELNNHRAQVVIMKQSIALVKKESQSLQSELDQLNQSFQESREKLESVETQALLKEEKIEALKMHLDRSEKKVRAQYDSITWKVGKTILYPFTFLLKK